MTVSYATIDATKLDLSPVQVLFKGPGALADVDLGSTLGNVTVDIKYGKAELHADQLGKTVLDRRVNSVEIKVTTEIAEIKNKDFWKVVFPHADLAGTSPNQYLDFKSMIGDGDLVNAGELTLHPLSSAPTDKNFDYFAWKACASAESQLVYGPDNQLRLKIVWNILPDTSVTPARFFRHGDKTL